MGNSDDLHLRRPEPIDQPERETVSKPADDDRRRVSVRAHGAHPTVSRLFRPRQEIRRPALIRDRCSTLRGRAIRSLRRGEIRPSFTAASVRYALWQAPPPPESLSRRRSRARDYVAVRILAKPARRPGQEGHRALPPTRARDALARLALAPGSLSRFRNRSCHPIDLSCEKRILGL